MAHKDQDIYDPAINEKICGFIESERVSFGKLLNKGFVDTFRYFYPKRVQYSFWYAQANHRPYNHGWRIDYILVSQSILERVLEVEIWEKVLGSDHCPVSIMFAAGDNLENLMKDWEPKRQGVIEKNKVIPNPEEIQKK